MIERHIINIGYPKCGTNWLWAHLNHLLKTNYNNSEKEPQIFLDQPNINKYVEYYKNQKVSMNFQPHLCQIDQLLIRKLSCVASHLSIILRNPYELTESWLIQTNHRGSLEQFLWFEFDQKFLHQAEIITRWQKNATKPLGVFFFDNLQTDPKNFLTNYLNFCNLDIELDPTVDYSHPINRTIVRTCIDFPELYRQKINHQIDLLEPLLKKDLSHWRR